MDTRATDLEPVKNRTGLRRRYMPDFSLNIPFNMRLKISDILLCSNIIITIYVYKIIIIDLYNAFRSYITSEGLDN